MILQQIKTPNGITANKTLNKLSKKLNKKYKNSNIKIGFDMGFDTQWELIINNTKTDRAMVLKQSHKSNTAQEVFIYVDSFNNQPTHNEHICVNDRGLEDMCGKIIPLLSK